MLPHATCLDSISGITVVDEHGGPESVTWAFFRHENQAGRERYA